MKLPSKWWLEAHAVSKKIYHMDAVFVKYTTYEWLLQKNQQVVICLILWELAKSFAK